MIGVEGLSFAYRRQPDILADLCFAAAPGEMVALTGPSGCGKSTLLYILGLMIRPRLGKVLLDGQSVSQLRDFERADIRARRMGFVFQDSCLDPSRSIHENVLEGVVYRGGSRRKVGSAAENLLREVSIDVDLSRPPGEISGGQAQRVALVRALVGAPSVILADEPTGNLDRVSADLVLSRLRAESAAGRVVVIATHDDRVINRCDREVRL